MEYYGIDRSLVTVIEGLDISRKAEHSSGDSPHQTRRTLDDLEFLGTDWKKYNLIDWRLILKSTTASANYHVATLNDMLYCVPESGLTVSVYKINAHQTISYVRECKTGINDRLIQISATQLETVYVVSGKCI